MTSVLTPEQRAKIAEDVHAHFAGAGPAGWQKDAYASAIGRGKVDYDHPEATCFSLCGIILRRTGHEGKGRAADDEMLIAYVRHGLALPTARPATAASAIAGFNDYPARTFEDVVALCAKVAEALRAEAG